MADGSIKIDTKIDSSSLPKQLRSMETEVKKSTSAMGESFAKMRDVMQGPVAVAKMVKDGLVAIGKAVIGPAAEIEDFVAAFTPLTGSVENAKKMIAALNKEAATTPFELKDIAAVGKQLLPVLGNDVKKVTETFRMLGDTAGGNAEKLDSIARGYVKVMNTGKVSMEALNMISDAGVPIQSQLAKSMGITVEEMYKLSSQGNISASELTKAFQTMTTEGGIFYNGMAVASETLSGKTSTMNDSLKMAAAAIGDRLLPTVKDITTAVSNAANGFTDFISDHTDLAKETNTLITASGNYETAVRNLDNAQKGISETERGLLTGRKELARLELQKSLAETSKGYARTKEEIAKLRKEEEGHNNNIKTQTDLLNLWRNIVEAPPTKQLAMAKQAGVNIDMANESFKNAAKNLESENTKLIKTQTRLQSVTVEYSESIAALGRAVNDGTLKIDIYKLTNKELYDEVMASAESQKVLARETTKTGDSAKASASNLEKTTTATTKLNNTAEETPAILNDIQSALNSVFQDFATKSAGWSDTFKSIGSTIKTAIGDSLKQIGESLVTGNGFEEFGKIAMLALSQVLSALGSQLLALSAIEIAQGHYAKAAGLAAAGAVAFVASGIASAMAETATAAEQLAENTREAYAALIDILRGGKSPFEDFLGSKQAADYLDKVSTAATDSATALAKYQDAYARAYRESYNATMSASRGTAIKAEADKKAAEYAVLATKSLKDQSDAAIKYADAIKDVYDTVYKNNAVTSKSSAILEKWATELQSNIIAFGKTSKEVEAVNENYQSLLNDALYPMAAALREANGALRENKSLWTDAAKASYAFDSALNSIRDKAASFYESFADIGSDIADTLVSSLTDGLDETSFLDAMKEYITKMVIQAAVYTEALTEKIANIGKKIASAIAGGLTGNSLSGIKQELSDLYAEASGKASAAMDIVNSAFAGNAGVASIAGGLGSSLTPSVATTGGSNITVTVNATNTTVLDGRAIATSVAENIDSVVAAI